jgi:hypothetical protein
MKITILATSLVTALSLGVRAGAAPAAAAPAPAPPRVAPAPSPTTPPNQAIPARPGFPGPVERTVGPGISATSTISSNPVTPSNQVGMATNELAMSNNVAATGNSNDLNSRFLIRDQAVTASDRQLLATLSQSVDAQLGVTSPGVSTVHFLIDNGAVTLVGVVSTADESQRITARVQQTPGVLSVFNDLHIGTRPTEVRPKSEFFGRVGNRAFSPADQSLLTTVEQESAAQLGISGASTVQLPVHFSIQNGVVGVTGQLTSAQEKQALLAAIQRTPGVVRVVDNVTVFGGANTVVTTPNPAVPNGTLPPTSGPNQSNRMFFLNPSNTTGF